MCFLAYPVDNNRAIETRISVRNDTQRSYKGVDRSNLVEINPIPVVYSNRENNTNFNKNRYSTRIEIDLKTNEFIPRKECLKVGSINCQSVRNKTDQILDYIAEKELSVCALNETWLKSDDDLVCRQITPKGYTLTTQNREGCKGGGVAVIFDNRLKGKRLSDLPSFRSFEYLVIQCNVNGQSLLICSIYRIPPSTKNGLTKKEFLNDLSNFLEILTIKPDKLLLIGDFNVHWDNTTDTETEAFKELLKSFDLTQFVNGPTHEKGHTLDFAITRANDDIMSHCQLGEFISDHCTIDLFLRFKSFKPKREIIKFRKIKDINIESFRKDIRSLNLEKVDSNDPNVLVENYNTEMINLLDKHAPEKTKTVVVRKKCLGLIMKLKRKNKNVETSKIHGEKLNKAKLKNKMQKQVRK